MKMKTRSMMLALAAGFAIFATPLGASAEAVAKIGDTEYATVDAAMDAAAASGTATTVTLLADSTDSTVVPTWYIKNDITIDAAAKVTATFAPTANADGVGANVGGLAYLTSADTTTMRTVTVGENVTLVFTNATSGLNAFYVGRNGSAAFVPTKLVLNGNVRAYQPYLGAQSIMEISSTGSLKAEWSECLQTRWGSSLTVTGTNGGWSKEKPQASFSYVNQRGGEITFKDTFVKVGLTWGGNWTIKNSDNKTDCATKLTLDNTSLDGISRFDGSGTSAYEIELKNKAKLTIKTDYAGSAGSGYFKNVAAGVVKIEAGSLITAVSVENAGKFVIDATGITKATKVFDHTGADTLTLESYGTVEVTGGSAYVEDNDLWVKPLASVAKIGETEYKTLGDALAAVGEGKPLTWVDDTTWPVETPVYYNGTFYAATDAKGALEVAIDAANEANADDIAKIYVRPGFETASGLLLQSHQLMTTSITIYGNDAKLPGGRHWSVECPSGSCTSDESSAQPLTKNVSLTICNLHNGAGFCCVRKTDYTVDLKLSACTNAFGVMNYTSAATVNKGKTNIAISDCLFDAHAWAGDAANCVAVVGAGTIEITGSTFKGVSVNVKNINGGDNAITVKNCAFTETGASSKNIRVRSFVDGAKATLTVENVTFEGSATKNFELGDNDGEDHGTVTYLISGTAGSLYLYTGTTTATTTALESSRAYVGDNKSTTVATGEALAVKATANDATATVNLVLTDDDIAKVKESLSVGESEDVAEKLNATAENGNPAWVNLVAGIDAAKSVRADAEQNTDAAKIDVEVPEVGTASAVAGAGVEVAYSVDVVDEAGSKVETAGEAVATPAIDVDSVQTSAYFRVNVLVRQNGATLAKVPAENVVGVLKLAPKAKMSIVPVPWHSLADGGDIAVSNVVKTANLTEGDKLHVYSQAKNRYDVYTLAADKTWTPAAVYAIDAKGQVSSESSGTPETTTIARGSGVWLERQDTSTPIVTYGQAASAKQETAMAAGTKEEPKWSLAAVPSTESVALETIAAPASSADDKVIVPTDGAPKIYTVENGAWGYSETVEITNKFGKKGVKSVRKTDTKLEPGTGFWYLNAGSEKTVNW